MKSPFLILSIFEPIIFPLVVTCVVEIKNFDPESRYMQSELYPRLVQDVQLMINELENVTVLWEELWLSTLQDLHSGRLISLGQHFK